ncbi:DUF4430 domain-containing protein [bacterium 1xD8-48]|nr:DUF4430 domain-containing protein [bacterium 1xD8-48]
MKRISVSKRLTYIICMALTLATVLFAAGCGNGADKKAEGDLTEDAVAEEGSQAQGAGAIGEGNTVFPFTVVDKDGNETKFEVHTDKEIVGEALEELGLISGDEGEYGLYVKTVNGITADYDADGVYWAFYVNGEYAVSGVDSTPIAEGESYSFKVEKG